MPFVRRLAAVLAAAIALVTFVGPGTAGAGTVAPDAQEVVRPIVFPVAGEVSYSNTFGACRSGCSRGHEGTDLMAKKLTPLIAATDGTVTGLKDTATPDGSNGNYLMIRDAEGWEYWYIHVNNDSPGTDDGANPEEWIFAPGIERGTKVKAGQLVAYVGDSGNAEWTAPHLHFEIHKPDRSVINPFKSLRAARRVPSPLVVLGTDATRTQEAFVRALYADFLGQDAPADVEMATRVTDLVTGKSRGAIVSSFAGSDQWIAALVDDYYRSTLGRAADAGGRTHWIRVIKGGETPAKVAADFYASDEYHHRVGGTDRAWLADLYRELLHRNADSGGVDYWVGQLRAGVPRGRVAHAFYQSEESRQTRVTGLYEQLLGRAPEPAGREHWVRQLADGQDVRLAADLASSDEYAARAVSRFS